MEKEIELPKIPERQIKKHLYLPESMDDITTDALEAMGYVQFEPNQFSHKGEK